MEFQVILSIFTLAVVIVLAATLFFRRDRDQHDPLISQYLSQSAKQVEELRRQGTAH